MGNTAFELVEPNVQIFEGWQLEEEGREAAGKAVVAEIQLEEEFKIQETGREGTAEPVGVDVEQRNVIEKPQLMRQTSGHITVVDINPGHGALGGLVRRPPTEHASIVTHVGSNPVGCNIIRI